MTKDDAIEIIKDVTWKDFGRHPDFPEAREAAIQALNEVEEYRAIGTPEECLRNKDFLDYLSDKMNPNDFETYLRLYNALEEKGCEE